MSTKKKEEEYVPTSQVFRRALEATLRALEALKDAHYATSKAHGFSVSTESTLFDSVVPVVNIAATLLARNVAFIEEQEKKLGNHRFPQLDEDAPPVPPGMSPRDGVEYGCGKDVCRDCYEEAK
jgi:hypothetical protein